MNFNEYEKNYVTRKVSHPDEIKVEGIAVGLVALMGEIGEVAEHIKKHAWHEKPLDLDLVEEELGDVLWYLTWLAAASGTSLEKIALCNAKKIDLRFPDGFDPSKVDVGK